MNRQPLYCSVPHMRGDEPLLNNIEADRETVPDWDEGKSAFENIVDMIVGTWGAVTYTNDQLEDIVIKRYVAADPPEMLGDWDGANYTALGAATSEREELS